MRRGDVYVVDLEPSRGSEADKVRPAVVVGNDAANRVVERGGRGTVTIVPVTSNVGRVYPFQVLIAAGEGGLTVDSKAQAEQVRTVDLRRLRHRLGSVKPDTMGDLDAALRIHLGI
jgi:mRNA interferase MazF